MSLCDGVNQYAIYLLKLGQNKTSNFKIMCNKS